MEDPTERLVKIYLESKGFFVRTNEKITIGTNKPLEIDLIAIRIKKNTKDNLPDKIIGEVKSWSLTLQNFPDENCEEKYKRHKGKFKTHFENRKETEKEITKRYGREFKFYIFTKDYAKKNASHIEKKLKQWKIKFIPLKEIAKEIVNSVKGNTYSNYSELQLIRILKRDKIELI
jgi:hypothetical protein